MKAGRIDVGLKKNLLDSVIDVATSDINDYFKNSKSGKYKEYYYGLAHGLYYIADTLADYIGIQNNIYEEKNHEKFIKLVKRLENDIKKNDSDKDLIKYFSK